MTRSSRALVALVAVLATVVPATTAMAAEGDAPPRPEKLSVRVEINGFAAQNGQTVAKGNVRAVLSDRKSGNNLVINQPVTLSARRGGSCRILSLVLDELNLELLGLTAHLDKVDLRVTGNRAGGVLGKLFCRLANADVKALGSNARVVRSLNRKVGKRPLRPLSFSTYVTPTAERSQAAPDECPVLDLVVGPLDLDLLGLVVKLNKVKLTVVARRGRGSVGDRFCELQ